MTIEVGNTAWASGIWTGGITGLGAIITTPESAGAWQWITGVLLTGLFGVASSAVTVAVAMLVKHWIENRKKDKD